MAIIKNALTYGFGFNVTAAGPVDSRMRVNYLADLTTVWGTSKGGVFTPNPDAPVYAGMQVIVNEQNKAYILKQQVAEGYTLDDKTQVVKNGLVYNKADDAPIAANPTDINNWVPVGTDFSGDISVITGRIDDIDEQLDTIESRFSLGTNSGLKLEENGSLSVNLLQDSDTFINGIYAGENGLYVPSYTFRKKNSDINEAYAAQYEFTAHGPNGPVTTTIDIPKDQFLQNAEFITASSVDTEVDSSVIVGDPYLKFTWQLDTDPDVSGTQNITYVPVKSLVDVYKAGNYITITQNSISVNTTDLFAAIDTEFDLTNIAAELESVKTVLGDSKDPGIVADVETIKSDIDTINDSIYDLTQNTNNLASGLSQVQSDIRTIKTDVNACKVKDVDTTSSYGVNLSLITPEGEDTPTHVKVNVDIDALAAEIIAKHEVPAPIAKNISVETTGSYVNSDDKQWNVQSVLADLDTRITSAVSGGLTKVDNGFGINVSEVSGNKQTISVKTSDLIAAGSSLQVIENKIDIVWSEL